MSKFLKLVENNLPLGEDVGMDTMVDRLVELLDTIGSVTVTSTAPSRELSIELDGYTILLEVRDIYAGKKKEEEEETKYDVDRKVEDLASQAKTGVGGAVAGVFGSSAQKARQAVNRREALVKQAIPLYDEVTKSLSNAINAAKKQY